MSRENSQKGFTMIELMVSILIVAVMATIAIPITNEFKKKAYDATAIVLKADFTTAAEAILSDLNPIPAACIAGGRAYIDWVGSPILGPDTMSGCQAGGLWADDFMNRSDLVGDKKMFYHLYVHNSVTYKDYIRVRTGCCRGATFYEYRSTSTLQADGTTPGTHEYQYDVGSAEHAILDALYCD